MFIKHSLTSSLLATLFITQTAFSAEIPVIEKKDIGEVLLQQNIKPKSINKYPGVEWQPAPKQLQRKLPRLQGSKKLLVVPKPLQGNIVLKPSMQLMRTATVDVDQLKKSWVKVEKYYKKTYSALMFKEMPTGSGAAMPNYPSLSGMFPNLSNNIQPPENLFEALGRSLECTDKNYNVEDQRNAGCVANETLKQCQIKLIKDCVKNTQKDLNLKQLAKESLEALDDISVQARRLKQQISTAMKPQYR